MYATEATCARNKNDWIGGTVNIKGLRDVYHYPQSVFSEEIRDVVIVCFREQAAGRFRIRMHGRTCVDHVSNQTLRVVAVEYGIETFGDISHVGTRGFIHASILEMF